MAEKFRSFYINHVPHQQIASLTLLAGATEKVLIYNYDLYCPRLALEDSQTLERDLQVNEIFETSISPELRNWQFPSSTT